MAGVSNTDWSWSVLFCDFDNDGWKDLFITNGVKRAMRNSDLDLKYSAILDSLELIAAEQNKGVWEVFDIMDLVKMAVRPVIYSAKCSSAEPDRHGPGPYPIALESSAENCA